MIYLGFVDTTCDLATDVGVGTVDSGTEGKEPHASVSSPGRTEVPDMEKIQGIGNKAGQSLV
jgi:hypothetical protein